MKEYFLALLRMVEGRPLVVPLGCEINKKNVALEAGRDPSAIKSSRESFRLLIAEIEVERSKQSAPKNKAVEKMRRTKEKLDEMTAERDRLKVELEQSRKQCLMLLKEIFAIKKERHHAKPVKAQISPKIMFPEGGS